MSRYPEHVKKISFLGFICIKKELANRITLEIGFLLASSILIQSQVRTLLSVSNRIQRHSITHYSVFIIYVLASIVGCFSLSGLLLMNNSSTLIMIDAILPHLGHSSSTLVPGSPLQSFLPQ